MLQRVNEGNREKPMVESRTGEASQPASQLVSQPEEQAREEQKETMAERLDARRERSRNELDSVNEWKRDGRWMLGEGGKEGDAEITI